MVLVLLVSAQCKTFGGAIPVRRRAVPALAGIALAFVAAGVGRNAAAYGPAGHRLVGRLAEPYLCAAADAEVRRLGGDGRAALGQWADRIRGEERWQHMAPWHYMNVADTASVAARRRPPEGDVLWAIRHFSDLLADAEVSRQRRAEALKFLVHFIADIHQPLHVGRESDRGGNTIELRVGARTTNLHRFWDTDVIRLRSRGEPDHFGALRRDVEAHYGQWADQPPLVWAEESHALRAAVYGFELGADGRPDAGYVARAGEITDRRLAQAAVRLAATLNGMLCEPAG